MEKVRQAMELAIQERWERSSVPDWERPPAEELPDSDPGEPLARRRDRLVEQTPLDRTVQPAPEPRDAACPLVRSIAINDETLIQRKLIAGVRPAAQREHYVLLQAAVLERLEARNVRRLGVTGPASGSGKTLTAVNLAMSLALEAEQHVLLVDLNLGKPAIHRLFDLETGPGIEDVLFRGTALNHAMFSPAIESLTVVRAGGDSEVAERVLRSSALAGVFAELDRLYADALMIVDLPTIASTDDVEAYTEFVDAFLLVVEDGVTKTKDYRIALRALRNSNLIGTVLNNSDMQEK